MEIYFKLFEVLFPVFFVVGIGYFLGKKNPKLDTTFIANFGNPIVSLSSAVNDPNGYGSFEYSTGSGYALCTKNLAEFGG